VVIKKSSETGRSSIEWIRVFETPACHDMNVGAEELNWQLKNNGRKRTGL
jgi:hypothetical protein